MPSADSSGRGHAASQTGGETSQQSGHGRAGAGSFEKTVGTTTHRAEDTAKRATTSEQKIGMCEGSLTESAKKR